MDPREDRLARNEEIFRRVNERLRELGEAFSIVSERATFVCECSDATCAEQIEMTLAEYEFARENPARFLMLPGHELPELETVIRKTEHYVIVEKPIEKVAEASEG
jgi:hypothetical protein